MLLVIMHDFVPNICIYQKMFVSLHPLGAGNKQANRKIMADIEKSHHSQDLARVRTESFKTLLDDIRHIIEKGLQEAYFIGSQI